jgi:phage-related protein
MADIHIPAYTPIYPISKVVRPKHRQARLPEWGIEQRKTFGLNQTAPEWNVRWLLRPHEADDLDAFFADRAKKNEWFLWKPPYHAQGRFRCDNWTKNVASPAHSEVQATIRQVFSYNFPSFKPRFSTFNLTGKAIVFRRTYTVITSTGSFTLSGADAGLSKTRPVYPEVGSFSVTGRAANLQRGYLVQSTSLALSYSGGDVTFLYLSLQSDYFGNMASQIWGWDRDFQVDWWGD